MVAGAGCMVASASGRDRDEGEHPGPSSYRGTSRLEYTVTSHVTRQGVAASRQPAMQPAMQPARARRADRWRCSLKMLKKTVAALGPKA